MELLLNLVWVTLALGALCAFATGRRESPHSHYVTALLALACIVVLLFPIISASDDLHPVQAAVEDASKRVQLALQAGSSARSVSPTAAILFVAFAMHLLFPAGASWRSRQRVVRVRALDRESIPAPGRAPPSSFLQ